MQRMHKPTIILGGRTEHINPAVSAPIKQLSSPIIDLSSVINKHVVIRYIDPKLVALLA